MVDVEGVDRFKDELGPWIVAEAAKPYDGSTEFACYCPLHEDPATSKKPSCTWQPLAKSKAMTLGVFHCHTPGCELPADGRKVLKLWRERMGTDTPEDEAVPAGWGEGLTGEKRVKPRPRRATLHGWPDDEEWAVYVEELADHVEWFLREKGIKAQTLAAFGFGFHIGNGCYIYPVYRPDGTLEGYRLYDPFHSDRDKKRWYRTREHHTNQLHGLIDLVIENDTCILAEGETDLMLMRQDGFANALAQTGGAGTWKPEWSSYFDDKRVAIVYDPDKAGRAGREMVANRLKGHAASVAFIDLPGGDYCEWRAQGNTAEAFAQLVETAEPVWEATTGLPTSGKPLESIAQLKDVSDARIVEGRAYISGKAPEPWQLPKNGKLHCNTDQGKKCQGCPMFGGTFKEPSSMTFSTSPADDDDLLAMLNGSDKDVKTALAEIAELKCNHIAIEQDAVWNVEQISIHDPVDLMTNAMDDARYSAFHFYDDGTSKVATSHDYRFIGRRLPNPRSQQLMVVAWNAERTSTDIDTFKLTQPVRRSLERVHRPKAYNVQQIDAFLQAKYRDLSVNVTKIINRFDLHFIADLVYHSAIEFDYNGIHIAKALIDALALGDTRTGKSELLTRIIAHYAAGMMVSGENTSFAGLIGGSAEIIGSRTRMPEWGVFPRQHHRMVVVDETSGMSELMSKMSSVRSSGIAEINKMGGGRVPAATRVLWLGNPAPHDRSNRTRKIKDYGNGVIDALQDLVKSQEDIARFDLVLGVTSEDVDEDAIFAGRAQEVAHVFTSEVCHSLVMFAWSRTRGQITFAPGVIEEIQNAARYLANRFIENPPLIQGSNVDVKIAKMAVSLAIITYSVGEDGETVIVRKAHVEYMRRFIDRIYSAEHFGYGYISEQQREFEQLGEDMSDDIREMFSNKDGNVFGIPVRVALTTLQMMGSGFTIRDLQDASGSADVSTFVNYMAENGMLRRVGSAGRFGVSDAFRPILRDLSKQQQRRKRKESHG